MNGVLVGDGSIDGGEHGLMIALHGIIQLIDSKSYTEDEDSNSAAFISNYLLYLLVDRLELFQPDLVHRLCVLAGVCRRIAHCLTASNGSVGVCIPHLLLGRLPIT